MTTVAAGPNYVAYTSRIEAFKSTTVGVSGTAYLRERLPQPRSSKQLPRSRRRVT